MRTPDPADYAWWLASRAAGVVAMALISLSVLIGLTMATGVLRRPGLKRTLLKAHEHLALAGLVAIAVHAVTLMGDAWMNPGLAGVLVPFALDYRPVFTGIGILAGYLALVLGLSFYVRRRIGGRLWRRLHRATVGVWVLGVVHALGAGSDASTPWLRATLLVTGLPIVYLFTLRMLQDRVPRPARSRHADGLVAERHDVAAA
jgi:sulfoxide reductase heme-binding subunit YedZ